MFDKAFSGLEAAIVLIAFVVVAAVFSYVMLGAGFFEGNGAGDTISGTIEDKTISFTDGGMEYYHLKIRTGNGMIVSKVVDMQTYYDHNKGDYITLS